VIRPLPDDLPIPDAAPLPVLEPEVVAVIERTQAEREPEPA
jgi:hypothetical protein